MFPKDELAQRSKDETAPVLIYHGLNGVYISEYKRWIRLDARGNKEGVNAQFSMDTEQLAFSIRSEKGEEDILIVFPEPDAKVLDKIRKKKTRTELWKDLPIELAYNRQLSSLFREYLSWHCYYSFWQER